MMIPSESFNADPKWRFVTELGIGALSLLLANAAVMLCYFIYDMTLFQLVMVYWCECLWIGVASALKLVIASVIGDPYENRWVSFSPGARVFLSCAVIFFASSGFFFLLGMTLMLILIANDSLALSSPQDDALNHIGLVLGVSFILLVGHALSFVVNFLFHREYRAAKVGTLLALPYKRSLALLTVIAVSVGVVMFVPGLASTTAFAVVVILFKVLWDTALHFSERRGFAA
ncbi:MAG: DUF6498-containing protein [Woeseia sp.]